jgi:hypothetical protein
MIAQCEFALSYHTLFMTSLTDVSGGEAVGKELGSGRPMSGGLPPP